MQLGGWGEGLGQQKCKILRACDFGSLVPTHEDMPSWALSSAAAPHLQGPTLPCLGTLPALHTAPCQAPGCGQAVAQAVFGSQVGMVGQALLRHITPGKASQAAMLWGGAHLQ